MGSLAGLLTGSTRSYPSPYRSARHAAGPQSTWTGRARKEETSGDFLVRSLPQEAGPRSSGPERKGAPRESPASAGIGSTTQSLHFVKLAQSQEAATKAES